ncbi:MAG TPA: phytanoyl-CoA dioxygenase family protein [Bryobacteraceae bacterium]|jgi:hypothetical protein|nr:phytanoyl-CoA dioxygenase family protein [Bryobacteraceae bacterium]
MTGEEVARGVWQDGYCVIPGVIPQSEVELVKDAVWAQLEIQRVAWEAEVEKMRHVGQQLPPSGLLVAEGLINSLPDLGRHVTHPLIAGSCEALLGPLWRISAVSAIATLPGNQRGYWHADWPYNQTLATCIRAPYPDGVFNLSAIVPVTQFNAETGSTLIVPGSHRCPDNPTGRSDLDRTQSHPNELQVTASPGDALFYDSRLWHCVGANRSHHVRIIVTARYTPWWLNLQVRRKGSPEYLRTMSATSGKDNSVPMISRQAFEALASEVKPFFVHWVEE